MDCIYAFTITETEFNDFICSFSFSVTDYMLLEKITDIQFTYYKKSDFASWAVGRIFNESCELKWRKIGREFRAVLIAGDKELGGFTKKETIRHEQKEKKIFLWGIEANSKSTPSYEFKENEFIETIIPRVLTYPVKNVKENSRVILKVVEYLNAKGDLEFFRFKGVETYEQESL